MSHVECRWTRDHRLRSTLTIDNRRSLPIRVFAGTLRHRRDLWVGLRPNGVGLTKGTISGMLVADLACGVDNPLIADMQALGQPDALPPRPFLDVGVRARLGWELWRHRAEA